MIRVVKDLNEDLAAMLQSTAASGSSAGKFGLVFFKSRIKNPGI
jgi:hypothetical protein